MNARDYDSAGNSDYVSGGVGKQLGDSYRSFTKAEHDAFAAESARIDRRIIRLSVTNMVLTTGMACVVIPHVWGVF